MRRTTSRARAERARRDRTASPRPRATARRPAAPEPQGFEERLAALVGDRPDRIGLWAPALGFFLMLVAAASSHV